MKRIDIFGSINLDEIILVDELPSSHSKIRAKAVHRSLGGSAANTATWIAGQHDLEVRLIGNVGGDEEGKYCVEELRSRQIETEFIAQMAERRTARSWCFSTGTDKSIITFHDRPESYPPSQLTSRIGLADHVHVAGSEIVPANFDQSLMKGATVSLELKGSVHKDLLAIANVVFLNADELERSFGFSIEKLMSLGASIPGLRPDAVVVVTHGHLGSLAVSPPVIEKQAAQRALLFVDRTGAGDAFNAGFLSSWLYDHQDLSSALIAGNGFAARAISQIGGAKQCELH